VSKDLEEVSSQAINVFGSTASNIKQTLEVEFLIGKKIILSLRDFVSRVDYLITFLDLLLTNLFLISSDNFSLILAALKPEESYWYYFDPDLPLCGIYSYSQADPELEPEEVSLPHGITKYVVLLCMFFLSRSFFP
jgi:hypothetical protein